MSHTASWNSPEAPCARHMVSHQIALLRAACSTRERVIFGVSLLNVLTLPGGPTTFFECHLSSIFGGRAGRFVGRVVFFASSINDAGCIVHRFLVGKDPSNFGSENNDIRLQPWDHSRRSRLPRKRPRAFRDSPLLFRDPSQFS